MDVLYRGFETALLLCALVLGAAALAASSMPPHARSPVLDAVTLPMLTVVADGRAS